eukprot:TRINITY_DN8292_c0_g1_i1.p1 TRINITY_DN8292_c0_g1~~TRINITY_DN8292_c0_g1_i1.p1  ORF type:complete len:682 (+),score=141.97 TRINITY_DN8292_c0_g1_i1:378-2423(+)
MVDGTSVAAVRSASSGMAAGAKEGGGENDGTQKEANGPKSPWKKPVVGGRPAEAPVMGAELWPALDEVRAKNSDAPAKPMLTITVPPPPPGPSGPRKLDGFGSAGPNKLPQPNNHKSVSKRNASTTGVPPPPFPVPLTYQQPLMPPVGHTVIPPHHFPVHEYPYPTYPGPFPNAEPHLVKPGSETSVPPFILPSHGRGGGIDANRAFRPPQVDPSAYNGNFPNGWHAAQEPGGRFNYAWRHHRAFNPRDNVNMQHPRAFIRPPPPFFGPAPGFINGPSFPGPAPVYYVPAPPPETIRGPRFISHPPHLAYPIPPLDPLALRANLLKQIEYYFSDRNLQTDRHLLSLMDGEGWVPISKIADFNRVKRMTTKIPVILESLQNSSSVEVQGDKIRRRDEWSKWLSTPERHSFSSKPHSLQDQIEEKTLVSMKVDVNEGNSMSIEEHRECPSNGDDLDDLLSSKDDSSFGRVLSAEESRTWQEGTEDLSVSSSEMKCSDISTSNSCVSANNSGNAIGDRKNVHSDCRVNSGCSMEAASSPYCAKPESKNGAALSGLTPAMQNLDGLSNDFLNKHSRFTEEQSTFLLDEEMELEQTTVRKDQPSSSKRIDDEDDEMDVNDQDVQRLIIVTQNIRIDEDDIAGARKSEPISNELATAINDGLYFYEQVHGFFVYISSFLLNSLYPWW